MALEVVTALRHALATNAPIRQSDLVALLATTEQLWLQAQRGGLRLTPSTRRDYMRSYMRSYRARKRATCDAPLVATGDATTAS